MRAYRVISGKHQHDRHGGIVSMKETISHEQGSRKNKTKLGICHAEEQKETRISRSMSQQSTVQKRSREIKSGKYWLKS